MDPTQTQPAEETFAPPPAPLTVRLPRPIKDFGQTITELVIDREMDGADLLAVDNLPPARTLLTFVHRLYRTREGKQLSWQAIESMPRVTIKLLEKSMAPFAGEAGPGTSTPSTGG